MFDFLLLLDNINMRNDASNWNEEFEVVHGNVPSNHKNPEQHALFLVDEHTKSHFYCSSRNEQLIAAVTYQQQFLLLLKSAQQYLHLLF